MVDGAERALAAQHEGQPRSAAQHHDLHQLVVGKRRQYAPQRLREHRLARAGRADEEYIVMARCGYFKRALRRGLPLNFGEVGVRGRLGAFYFAFFYRFKGFLAAQVHDEALEVRHAPRTDALDYRDLGGILGRHEELHAVLTREEGRGHRAAHTAEPAVERKLADVERGALRPHAPGLLGERDGYRQVEHRALLGQVCRSKVDRDAPAQQDVHGTQRRAHALAGLLDRRVRQADDGKGGHSARYLRLDLYRGPRHATKRKSRDVPHITGSVIFLMSSMFISPPSYKVTATRSMRQKPM